MYIAITIDGQRIIPLKGGSALVQTIDTRESNPECWYGIRPDVCECFDFALYHGTCRHIRAYRHYLNLESPAPTVEAIVDGLTASSQESAERRAVEAGW